MKRIDMRALFKKINKDNTEKITFENLRSVANELGEKYTDDDLRDMIKEADRDKDGVVSFDEFARILDKNKLI